LPAKVRKSPDISPFSTRKKGFLYKLCGKLARIDKKCVTLQPKKLKNKKSPYRNGTVTREIQKLP
jgi:hypothetical protein